ncbi:MAG: TerD family protein [Deltaproteobacteria bacterium]|jgi:stress response protein SCP2|nr:TerD family protein [Deltaproteobacteria bacterium]
MPVVLRKGQSVSLEETRGAELAQIIVGLGWGPFTYTHSDIPEPRYYFFDRANVLFEDETNGDPPEDEDSGSGNLPEPREVKEVDLLQLIFAGKNGLPYVKHIVFTIEAAEGVTFQDVNEVHLRVADRRSGTELVRYSLPGGGRRHRAIVVARLTHRKAGWTMKAVGEFVLSGKRERLMEAVRACL